MRAEPAPLMTDFTSAKSRLIRPGGGDQVGDALDAGEQDLVGRAERVERVTLRSQIESSRSFGMTMRVSTSARSVVDAGLGLVCRRRLPSKANGRVTTPMVRAPSWRAIRATTGAPPGAGAAALAGRHEDHVGALEDLLDLVRVVLGGLAADLGVGAGAEAAGELPADVELDVGVAHQQRLRVGVDGDELDALEPDLDHPVDGVDAAAADADDLDDREVVLRCRHGARPSWRTSRSGRG